MVEGDGAVKDYALAARFYRQAAHAGYARPNTIWAFLYEKGWDVALDLRDAAVWYRKAAEQGDAEAQNNLEALYATDREPRSYPEVVRWYRAASGAGRSGSTSNLAMMYLQGRGTPRDLEQAFELFQKAANQGYAVAQNNLALMYANGQAVARDYTWAYAWLDLAVDQPACAELRNGSAKEMTSDEIVRARKFAARKRVELEQQQKESK